jgi:hypothetical protein
LECAQIGRAIGVSAGCLASMKRAKYQLVFQLLLVSLNRGDCTVLEGKCSCPRGAEAGDCAHGIALLTYFSEEMKLHMKKIGRKTVPVDTTTYGEAESFILGLRIVEKPTKPRPGWGFVENRPEGATIKDLSDFATLTLEQLDEEVTVEVLKENLNYYKNNGIRLPDGSKVTVTGKKEELIDRIRVILNNLDDDLIGSPGISEEGSDAEEGSYFSGVDDDYVDDSIGDY